MKLCMHPNIDVERELSFLNLIVVVHNHDAKICVSFVTHGGVSVLLYSSFALFVLRSGFVQTTVIIFSKAICVNPQNHRNGNKSLTHSCKFFIKPCKIFDHS